jgi:hypothetical protein|nr:MAG TPA: hypothetical protein [Caudoviricetes sp.]
MKTERQNSKLAMLTKDVEGKLAVIAKNVEWYKEVMVEDYGRFFRWHSEDAYKMQVYKLEFERLLVRIGEGDMDKVREYLRNRMDGTQALLLEASVRGDVMTAVALANINELEAKRRMCDQYQMMLDTIGNDSQDEEHR